MLQIPKQIPKLNFVFFCQSYIYFFFILSNLFVHNFVKPFSGQGFFRPNKKNVLKTYFFGQHYFTDVILPRLLRLFFSICVKMRFKNIYWIKKFLNFVFGSGICSGMPAKTAKCNFLEIF